FTGLVLVTVADALSGFVRAPGSGDALPTRRIARIEFERSVSGDGLHTIRLRPTNHLGEPVGAYSVVRSHGDAIVLGYTVATPRRTLLARDATPWCRIDLVGGAWQQSLADFPSSSARPSLHVFGRGRPAGMLQGDASTVQFPFPWSLWVERWRYAETNPSDHQVANGAIAPGASMQAWNVVLTATGDVTLEPVVAD
ncbi:MAG: hypothetical protein AB7K09_01005, partial [Planctomycetota bacterium]